MQDWKKSSPQDCVSPRGHFASRLFLLSPSFSKINWSAKIRMALKRHTVLYRLRKNSFISDLKTKHNTLNITDQRLDLMTIFCIPFWPYDIVDEKSRTKISNTILFTHKQLQKIDFLGYHLGNDYSHTGSYFSSSGRDEDGDPDPIKGHNGHQCFKCVGQTYAECQANGKIINCKNEQFLCNIRENRLFGEVVKVI